MPYIVVNVMGAASKTGNGSIWVDGHPNSLIKDGEVIYVSSGTHSIKYVPTLKRSEWTTAISFDSNTVVIANVIDEDFSSPRFESHTVTNQKISELEELRKKQKEDKEKEDKSDGIKSCLFTILKIVGVLLVIGLIISTCSS